MRRGRELALAAALLAGCASGGERCAPGAVCAATSTPSATLTASGLPFRDDGATAQSGHDGGPEIMAVRAGAGLRITAYQGGQSSGGFAIRIERITRAGTELRVHARFTEPAPGSFNTMALTSPAHTVTIDETGDVVVLYDLTGTERARGRPR